VHQLHTATALEVQELHTSSSTPFDPREFYERNGLHPTHANWIKIYNASPSQSSLEYIKSYFSDSFVVGFELPNVLINAFEALSIPYIDTIIHPVRYLDDILLAFRTSDPKIYTNLKAYQIDEEYYIVHANIHKATMAKMKKPALKPNSMIFAGQVEVDKSLINGDTLMNLAHFEDKIAQLSKEYTHIYVKTHPYAKDNDKITAVFNKFANVGYTDQNIYYLLAQDRISALYSISSSTVLEAKYFGKKAEYLYKNPFYIDHDNREPNSEEYISIRDAFFMTSFWSEILNDVIPTKSVKPLPLPQKTNRLRNSLQNYWGYKFLDSDILLKSYDLYTDHPEESVSQILQEIRPQIERERANLEHKLLTDKRMRYILQKLRRIPILGRFLYFVKQKVLKWH
jgi:hypothetical protein